MIDITGKILILNKLEEKDVTLDQMIESALLLYIPYGDEDAEKDIKEIENRLKETIIHQCSDINVQLLILAAICLDERLETLGIHDYSYIVSDELIGIALAEYIGGKKALFNFVRYDREKPGILSNLGIFLDDAVGGLIAGCMTKLFEGWT
jgi:alpha-ribazole phosphatase CobZ